MHVCMCSCQWYSLFIVHRLSEVRHKSKKDFHDRLDSDEEEEETAPEKRVRLAKEYLSRLGEQGKGEATPTFSVVYTRYV